MRFLVGIAIGFGVGFAGAVLLAPDRTKRQSPAWPEARVESGPAGFDTDHDLMATVRRALRTVQDRVDEALEEAKKAQAETEREMRARYDRTMRHTTEEAPKVEAAKTKGTKGK